MPVFGLWDLLILLFVVLLIFGPKRIPMMGRSVGQSIHGFRDAVTSRHERLEREALPPASPEPAERPEPREHDTLV